MEPSGRGFPRHPPGAPVLVPTTAEIEGLRPRSPPGGGRGDRAVGGVLQGGRGG